MSRREYVIQAGDTFYRLAQRWGGTCDDWLQVNPGLDPAYLQIGQVVVLPSLAGLVPENFRTSSAGAAHVALGENLSGNPVVDEVEMEVEGVIFRVRRQGERQIPHEVHLILPRTEIRKVQQGGEICELQIMLSNVNIVHSPRIMSEGKEQEQIKADLIKVHDRQQEEEHATGTARYN